MFLRYVQVEIYQNIFLTNVLTALFDLIYSFFEKQKET